jgi:hypothetical protein
MAYYRRWSGRSHSYNNTQDVVQREVPQISEQELTDPGLTDRIKNLATRPDLNNWEKEFLTSIGQYQLLKKRLSAGQYNAMRKIEENHSEEKLTKQKEFADSFTDEMRENMKIVAGIYRATNSVYHKELVNKILDDDKFVPTQEQYNKFMNNKYAQGYVVNYKVAPKFNIGDAVAPSSLDRYSQWKGAIVVQNTDILPMSHAAGGKRYMILPYGETNTVIVEERAIKFLR